MNYRTRSPEPDWQDGPSGSRLTARPRHSEQALVAPYHEMLAKSRIRSLFQAPQRVFEITPLVPGSPSLDVRPHSPGETRQGRNFDLRFRISIAPAIAGFQSSIENRYSKNRRCQSVTVVLKCR